MATFMAEYDIPFLACALVIQLYHKNPYFVLGLQYLHLGSESHQEPNTKTLFLIIHCLCTSYRLFTASYARSQQAPDGAPSLQPSLVGVLCALDPSQIRFP